MTDPAGSSGLLFRLRTFPSIHAQLLSWISVESQNQSLGSLEHLPLRGCDRMAIQVLANISSGFPVMAIDYALRNYPVANNAFSTRLAYKSSAAALKTKQQAHLGYCQRRVSSPPVTF